MEQDRDSKPQVNCLTPLGPPFGPEFQSSQEEVKYIERIRANWPGYRVILISPRRRSPEGLSRHQKREITPSVGSSLSKNLLIISPISAQPQPLLVPPCIFPSNVMLPFDLRRTPSKFLETENFKLLLEVFPGTQRVDFNDRVLVFHLDRLPAKPWPKKFAGVPCYLTEDANDQGPIIPIRHRSHARIKVSENLDLRDNKAAVSLIFDLVHDFFASHIIIIVLESEANKDEILRAAPRPVAQSDDSSYEIIRPGVMLSSGKHPEEGWEILTSSGVLVRGHRGFEYMTVTAHGFPGPLFDRKVHHPHSFNKTLGKAIIKLSHIDTALVQLIEGVEFVNEPFENTCMTVPSFKLTGFVQAAKTRIGNDIFLDSLFSGFIEGTRGPHSLLRVPSDDPFEPEQVWIRCQWGYIGQNSNQAIGDGVCGSVIWNENHKALGFF
ncbi:hypothetical protein BDV23DRAFT_194689 [Aspergillus alliaceus]|uniref:Uncharacterized protein n=1 Tax=Petromyces alliaceus TaxID=209559 RepID=A0A5N7C5B6_PETAA|nr:hypothetical protein BDV23DRAFT_194689 [Aspergillus alliaceus]